MAGSRNAVETAQGTGNQERENVQAAGDRTGGEQEKNPLKGSRMAQKTVQVKLPRLQGNNPNQDEFFSVNFKNYIVKRGKYVDVPPELEEVIKNGERAEEAAFAYAEEKALREA